MTPPPKELVNDPFSVDEELTGPPALRAVKPGNDEAPKPPGAGAVKPSRARAGKASRRETGKPASDGGDEPKSYNQTGSRGKPYKTREGVLMVKTTFTATFEHEFILSSFAGTLRSMPRNTWMEQVLTEAIVKERGPAWFKNARALAQQEIDRVKKEMEP